MEIVVLPALLATVLAFARRPLFEGTFAIILLSPLLAFGVAWTGGVDLGVSIYLLSFLVLLFGVIAVVRRGDSSYHLGSEVVPLLVFTGAFWFFHSLNQLWPDFMPMGERLRDYAIISSVVRNPLEANEPWMSGATLNYYLYWYRFCHLLTVIFGLEVWEVYARIQAFVCALYLSCGYVALRRWFGWRWWAALGGAIAISIGSNVAGVRDFLAGDLNWWGPSRVVKGAINEFPAWSFLLGDDHPHFLNLPLLPFIFLAGLRAFRGFNRGITRALLVAVLGAVSVQWIWYANAWELPAVLALIGAIVLCAGMRFLSPPPENSTARLAWSRDRGIGWIKNVPTFVPEQVKQLARNDRAIALGLLTLLGVVSLACIQGTANISSGGLEPALVGGSIVRTPTGELLLHWGFPLLLLGLALPFSFRSSLARVLGWVALAGALLYPRGWVFLAMLLILALRAVARDLSRAHPSEQVSAPGVVRAVSVLLALALILAPEIVFFNDSYGGDIERMNTIFKFYSAAWFWAHLAAFGYAGELASRCAGSLPRAVAPLLMGALLIFVTGFFFQTAKVRRSPPCEGVECAEGLAQLNRENPGAAALIRHLRQMRPGVVIEAQGGPYSLTTHVATLSGQTAYLGWANHINLLTKQYDEVGRRERITKEIYEEPRCEEVRKLLHTEEISYLIIGPLEAKHYRTARTVDRGCLTKALQVGEYTLYLP